MDLQTNPGRQSESKYYGCDYCWGSNQLTEHCSNYSKCQLRLDHMTRWNMGLCMWCGCDDHTYETCQSSEWWHPRGSQSADHLAFIDNWQTPKYHPTARAYERVRGRNTAKYDEYLFDLLRDQHINIYTWMWAYRNSPKHMNVVYTREYERAQSGETTREHGHTRPAAVHQPYTWPAWYRYAKWEAEAINGDRGIFTCLDDAAAAEKRGSNKGLGRFTGEILDHIPNLSEIEQTGGYGKADEKGTGRGHGSGPYEPSKGKGKDKGKNPGRGKGNWKAHGL